MSLEKLADKLPNGTIQFRGKLKGHKDDSGMTDWQRVYGMTEEQIKSLLYDDVEGNRIYGHDNKDRCKLNIWVRWVGKNNRYKLKMRSEYRRAVETGMIILNKNDWMLLNAFTMADTWSGTYGNSVDKSDNNTFLPPSKFEGYEKFNRYWMDVKYLLGEIAGKDYFQVRLDDPEQTDILPDKNFEIAGINPQTNPDGVNMSQLEEAIDNRFAIKIKKYDYYKADLVELWQELVVSNGNLSMKQINSFKKKNKEEGDD